VEAALENDDVRSFRTLPRELDRRLDCFGTGISEHDPLERSRHEADESLCEDLQKRVLIAVDLGMDERRGLLLNRADDARVTVTGTSDADT
jgi:hypothetical protein